jgi:hypothetical protein
MDIVAKTAAVRTSKTRSCRLQAMHICTCVHTGIRIGLRYGRIWKHFITPVTQLWIITKTI